MGGIDRSLLKTFAEESLDRLERIAAELEQFPVDPEELEEVIGSLFRETHNLKGAANLVGARSVEQLAHTLENILDQLRNGAEQPDAQLIAILDAGYRRIGDLLKNPQVLAFADATQDIAAIERHLSGRR